MAEPVTLRIERPYDSEGAYLEHEAWTVERSEMLLCNAGPLPAGTNVKFEIVLSTGAPVVRGEGRIVETVSPEGDRPGGLRVRFRQLDAPSKNVLRRALELQKKQARPGVAKAEPPVKAPPAEAPPAPAAPLVVETPAAAASSASEPSGVRHRIPGPVVPPGNRDVLLDRLRARAKKHAAAE